MKLVRALVREEIKKLMNDDALFGQRDIPGLESERDDLDMMPLPSGMPSSCPICGTDHEGPCHNPARKGGRRIVLHVKTTTIQNSKKCHRDF